MNTAVQRVRGRCTNSETTNSSPHTHTHTHKSNCDFIGRWKKLWDLITNKGEGEQSQPLARFGTEKNRREEEETKERAETEEE